MSAIEQRYAEAFLAAIPSKEVADNICEALNCFAKSFKEDIGLRDFFSSPSISNIIKKETVLKMFPDDGYKLLVNFLSLLLDKGRFSLVYEMAKKFSNLKDERQNNLKIEVYTALPIEQAQIDNIKTKYGTQFGSATTEVSTVINPNLIGGILIKIGDYRVDDTQLGRLKALRQSIN